MLRVLFATEDWGSHNGDLVPGGSAWWRVVMVADALGQAGVDVEVGRIVGTRDDPRLGVAPYRHRNYAGQCDYAAATVDADVVVLHRVMDGRVADAVKRARQAGQRIVVDVDDWWWGLRTSNPAFVHSHPRLDPGDNRDHLRRILAAADAVTCSTPYLARRLQRLGATVVVPNAINPALWPVTPRPVRPTGRRVGWVGATPWRSGDLQTLTGVLGPWLQRTGWGFHQGGHAEGSPTAAQQIGLPPSVTATSTGMVAPRRYPVLFRPLDVALVPLADNPFNAAKSAASGLAAAWVGVPFIASATPSYRQLEQQGIGRTARRPRDWVRHLDALTDPDTRGADVERNRAGVERRHLTATAVHRWLQVLEGATVAPSTTAAGR